MHLAQVLAIILPLFSSGQVPSTIKDIQLPPSFQRVKTVEGSFGHYLRNLPLRNDPTVYLYNGSRKPNQGAQFAVLNLAIGKENLLQCADMIMMLRSHYLFSLGNYTAIRFSAGDGTWLNYVDWCSGKRFVLKGNRLVPGVNSVGITRMNSRKSLDGFLDFVYRYAGTLSLEKQLTRTTSVWAMKPGDVFIQGGSPGHAMLVADMAENDRGEKLFLLMQGYMPAQEIHIVKNMGGAATQPWYLLKQSAVVTPEWTFEPSQLRSW